MSADRLREAARVLRVRAEAAYTPKALTPYGDERIGPQPRDHWPRMLDDYLGGDVGAYCATIHPGVGLALSEILDSFADVLVWQHPDPASLFPRGFLDKHLALADAILGGAA